MGGASKPLTCRLFPFRFHPGETATLVTASFCCPTVVRNEGATLGSQERDLAPLAKAWLREHPEAAGRTELVAGVPISAVGISPKLSYEIEKRPFYVTRDGLGKPILDLFA